MAAQSEIRASLHSLSVTSFVLGAVGLLLFFMPVLGIPLAGIGLLLGFSALLIALIGGPSSLRWSVLATALCVLALGADLLIAFAPADLTPSQPAGWRWQPPPSHSAPPPADPRIWSDDSDP